MRRTPYLFVALATAGLLTACGGGGNSGETKDRIGAVKVVGASLADSGTFGFKFTVQSASGTPYQVYTERIAATYGLGLCKHFTFTGVTFAEEAACNNYAIAGAAINYGTLSAGTNTFTPASSLDPRSQVNQLILLGAGGFASGDLLIVGEGSSNDAATLATAYLTDVQTSGATTLFAQVITSLLQDGGATAGLGIGAPDGGATAGVVYMTQLAQTLVATVKTEALDKGATRVAILNTLDVTRTPRFQTVLAGIAAQQNQAAADGVQALVRAWINAYNSALRAAVVPYAGKVVIVDAFQGFNDELDNLAQYGLTNKTSTVCFETFAAAGGTKTGASPQPVLPGTIGLGDDDVSTPVPPICNDATASSIRPTESDTGTDWWKTYLFADNFHPTPYGHQLLAQLVAKRLTEAGWL